jgi:SAM-dependent methyltransferase
VDQFIYDVRWQDDDVEWRARARRQAVMAMWRRYSNRESNGRTRILDIGCGTGAGLEEFRAFGTVTGIDFSETAIHYCRRRHCTQTAVADASLLPFESSHFDLVSMIEVLEHVEDDTATLAETARVLVPGGLIVLTVPAYQWLWTVRDERLQHKRRYTRARIIDQVVAAGLTVLWDTYIDSFLLAPLALMVGYSRLSRQDRHMNVYSVRHRGLLNRFLLGVCTSERMLYARLPLPCGVSVLCVAQRPR